MALHGRTAQKEVDLIVIVAVPTEVLDHAETSLSVRDGRVKVVLLAVLVDGESLESEVPAGAELGLDGTGEEDGGFHAHLGHAVFDDGELECDDAGHLDGTAEGDLAVSLGEVQVTDRELGSGNVDGEVDLGAAGEVFDVAVTAVFGATL